MNEWKWIVEPAERILDYPSLFEEAFDLEIDGHKTFGYGEEHQNASWLLKQLLDHVRFHAVLPKIRRGFRRNHELIFDLTDHLYPKLSLRNQIPGPDYDDDDFEYYPRLDKFEFVIELKLNRDFPHFPNVYDPLVSFNYDIQLYRSRPSFLTISHFSAMRAHVDWLNNDLDYWDENICDLVRSGHDYLEHVGNLKDQIVFSEYDFFDDPTYPPEDNVGSTQWQQNICKFDLIRRGWKNLVKENE